MTYQFDFSVLLENRDLLLRGVAITLRLFAVSFAASLVMGAAVGVGRTVRLRPIAAACGAWVETFRNVPLLIQIFIWYFGAYELFPDAVKERLQDLNWEFIASCIGLSLYTSAYMAEALRSCIQAVPRGQTEAARATGLSAAKAYAFVVLPQAARYSLPAMTNQTLNLLKNTSLAMTVSVAELTFQSQAIEAATFRGFEATAAAAAIYLGLCLILAAASQQIQKAFRLPGQAGA